MGDPTYPSAASRRLDRLEGGLCRMSLTRCYPASPVGVWAALTDPELLVRWFLPITGDLREGGRYELEGNAIGRILRCDRPRHLELTWEYAGFVSYVRLHLTPDGDATVLRLEHEPVPVEIVPNAGKVWGLGAVWELAMSALNGFVTGTFSEGRAVDRIAAASPRELKEFARQSRRSGAAWAALVRSIS
ncbi:MAG TPA: SRPBCC domain-containing protein [Actinomycetota bacterium]|nr:SRPBCC domain-containing protein [Actinomycetota bacterium]